MVERELEALRERRLDDRRKPGRNHRPFPLLQHRMQHLLHGGEVLVRQGAAEHLDDATTQAPYVHLLGDDAAGGEALGRHVSRGAAIVLIGRQALLPQRLRLPEVAELHAVVRVEHQVLRLQVPVDHYGVAPMHVLNRLRHCSCDLQTDGCRQIHPAHVQEIEHVAVRQKLRHHRQVRVLQHATYVPDDRWVIQRPVSVDLALQIQQLLLCHGAVVPKNAPLNAHVLALVH
mmetsp:Transcript_35653/g.102704  ORF Transcript_35653/g.102704 Transcript_35653/m.102704 type:complete len:231 (+) Transcript_35653:300-992(+)